MEGGTHTEVDLARLEACDINYFHVVKRVGEEMVVRR